jgi:hypothetical protein
MPKYLKKIVYPITLWLIGTGSALGVTTPTAKPPCEEDIANGKFCLPNFLPDETVGAIITRVENFLIMAAGSVVVVVVLVGAFQIMTAGGIPKNIERGKKTITWALIGFAIVLLSGGLGYVVASILGGTFEPLPGASDPTGPGTPEEVIGVIDTIAGWMFGILMALGTVFILYAAFLFLASTGNSEKIATARRALIWAIVALFIGVLAGSVSLLVKDVLDVSTPVAIPTDGGGHPLAQQAAIIRLIV